jgi:hypothetical protein
VEAIRSLREGKLTYRTLQEIYAQRDEILA